MYDDRPLWEQQKSKDQESNVIKPRIEHWKGLYKSADSPSPVQGWWTQNFLKLRNREENEIDIARIRQAIKGSFNEWFDGVRANKKLIDQYFNDIKTWDDIKHLKQKL